MMNLLTTGNIGIFTMHMHMHDHDSKQVSTASLQEFIQSVQAFRIGQLVSNGSCFSSSAVCVRAIHKRGVRNMDTVLWPTKLRNTLSTSKFACQLCKFMFQWFRQSAVNSRLAPHAAKLMASVSESYRSSKILDITRLSSFNVSFQSLQHFSKHCERHKKQVNLGVSGFAVSAQTRSIFFVKKKTPFCTINLIEMLS